MCSPTEAELICCPRIKGLLASYSKLIFVSHELQFKACCGQFAPRLKVLIFFLMINSLWFFSCSSLLNTAMTAFPPNVWSYCLSHLGLLWEFSSHLQWYFRLIPFWDNESAGHTSLAKSSYINFQKYWLPVIVYAHGHPQVTQISQIKPPLVFQKYY